MNLPDNLPDAPQLLQLAFTFAAASVILINAIPPFQRRFIPYGKVATPAGDASSSPPPSTNPISKLLDLLATFTVPHSYFEHFYIAGILSSLFWAWQIFTHGPVYQFLAARCPTGNGMSIHQVALVWLCFLAQLIRRFYECRFIQKKGTSRMWITHYLLGIAFYVLMSTAIWIEGTDAISSYTFTPLSVAALLRDPSLKTCIGFIPFVLASGLQHDAHAYLASLKKYSLPEHPMFYKLVCPHYLAEVIIYASLMVLAAPKGVWLNLTIWSGMVFVVCNLGVSSSHTRAWYEKKFGRDAVARKWNMVVGIY
ncbi:hypothetical protein EX30DRAFT_397306 [Ascodesmis nigricans]|uniref:Polyprenal reductase n=1 Tax=Ascodesmis nigricans TaxID=341454 RepID=A0A4S2MPZ6_9PEZI|nr:hypothetical protein EX30DRAFT_397306 [Ascodesmis nigricans]